MDIRADAPLAFPRARVFATYRDCQVDLAAHLPNIRGIRPLRRDDRPGEVELVTEWMGGGDIPAVARAIVRESMLTWTDHATWREAGFSVDWRTEVSVFPGAIRCSGKNSFIETAGGGTRIEFRGDFTCDATKVPGVPKLMAKTVSSTVEKLFVSTITANLAAVGKAVGKILDAQMRSAVPG